MGLGGPAFVGGTPALFFLLAAEVVAATAVVSEAALIYVARMRNLWISLGTIALQGGLTFGLILGARNLGFDANVQTALAAIAMTLSLGTSSLLKARLLSRIVAEPINNWRWTLIRAVVRRRWSGIGATVSRMGGNRAGHPAILGVYCFVLWRVVFGPEDRVLFRSSRRHEAAWQNRPFGEWAAVWPDRPALRSQHDRVDRSQWRARCGHCSCPARAAVAARLSSSSPSGTSRIS
jgi:hypothetical protein